MTLSPNATGAPKSAKRIDYTARIMAAVRQLEEAANLKNEVTFTGAVLAVGTSNLTLSRNGCSIDWCGTHFRWRESGTITITVPTNACAVVALVHRCRALERSPRLLHKRENSCQRKNRNHGGEILV
jgi:hypothetical protein